MKAVLIGSQAARHHFSDFREPKDWDFLVDGKQPNTDVIEYFDANLGVGIRQLYDESDAIASPSSLYTLKVSHVFFPSHLFNKTVADILFFQKKGVEYDYELGAELYKDWIRIHGPKRAKLNKSNEDFFQDAVDRIIPHDMIHEAVAYYKRPLYERIKYNLEYANVSHKLFNNLDFNDKLKLCREEIYATAIERFYLTGVSSSPNVIYRMALEKLITTMTQGWFPLFIILNLQHLIKPDLNFIKKFEERKPVCQLT